MMFPLAPSCGADGATPAANAKHFGEQSDLRASHRLAHPLWCRAVERIFAAAVLGAWLDPTMLHDKAADPAGPASDPGGVQIS